MEPYTTLDGFFAGYGRSRRLFDALLTAIGAFGEPEMRVSKSQVAFVHERTYAWVWIPGRYLKGETAPLVLSVALGHRDGSPRWKEVVEPAPGRYMHHLEIRGEHEIDDEVVSWLGEARRFAEAPRKMP